MILVTGGSGYIGSHLVIQLAEAGNPVRIFGRKPPVALPGTGVAGPPVEFSHGNLADDTALSRAMEGVDTVYHLGGVGPQHTGAGHLQQAFGVNVLGTLNVLTAARREGCRRVVFASSAAVYGTPAISPQREDMPVDPQSAYAIAKVTGEHLCQVFCRQYGLETVVLRYFNVYGPKQRPPFVVPRFVEALRTGGRITLHGDGAQIRDFVYVDDVVTATMQAATVPGAAGKVLNIGSGKPVTVKQLLAEVATILDKTPMIDSMPAPPGDIKESVAEIALARDVLDYGPAYSLRQGLRRSIESVSMLESNK